MASELTTELLSPPPQSFVARARATLRYYLPAILLLPAGLIVWELIVRVFNIQGFLLPAPSLIAQTFAGNSTALIDRGWYTFQEALGGYVLGCGLGILFGMITARFKTLSAAFMPFAIAINAVPIIALSPLARIWFGIDQASKVVIVAILCFFPVLISTVRGLTMLFLGLLLGLVGIDDQTGQMRFAFGVPELMDGIDVVVLAVPGSAAGDDGGP